MNLGWRRFCKMKKIYSYLAALLCLCTAAACSSVSDGFQEQPTTKEMHLVFSASFQNSAEATTRTSLQSNGKVFWSPKESIHVFNGTCQAKFTSTNTSAAETASFEGSITLTCDTPLPYIAVYPYSSGDSADGSIVTMTLPDAQKSKAGSFSDGMSPALAKTEPTFNEQLNEIPLGFKNLCSGLKFSLAHSGVTSISFKGNNGENIAGKVKVSFDSDGAPAVTQIVSGKKEITLTFDTNDPNKVFPTDTWLYLTFPPQTFSKGFTMTFNTSSEKGTYVHNGSVTFRRSVWKKAELIDSDVIFIDRDATVTNTVTVRPPVSDKTVWPTLAFMDVENDLEKAFFGSVDRGTWYGTTDGDLILHNVLPLFMQYCNSDGFTYYVLDKTETIDGVTYHKAQLVTRLPYIIFHLIRETGEGEGLPAEAFTYNGITTSDSYITVTPMVSPDGELVLKVSAPAPFSSDDHVIAIPFTTQKLVTKDKLSSSYLNDYAIQLVPENLRDYHNLDILDYSEIIYAQEDLDYSPIW